MSFVFYFNVWLIFQATHVLSIRRYDPTKVIDLADEEELNTIEIPNSKSLFFSFHKGAQYVGLLFAGKSEFSWVVDLRAKTYYNDPEERSTGNLISAKYVLTTGRAVRFLREGVASVTYCMQYLWEYQSYTRYEVAYNRPGNVALVPWRWGGTRNVVGYVMHPKSTTPKHLRTMSFDIAAVRLATPIDPAPPFIGFMPIARDPSYTYYPERFLNVNFFESQQKRQICLVGSIGRPYINLLFPLVEDYKVRYRVYIETWRTCQAMMDKLCNSDEHDCRAIMTKDVENGRDWACMRTRAEVGTVCDHDRGAPVVCDGEVVAIVVFGALKNFCNNRFPMPFVVTKLYQYQDFIYDHMPSPSPYDGIGLSLSHPRHSFPGNFKKNHSY